MTRFFAAVLAIGLAQTPPDAARSATFVVSLAESMQPFTERFNAHSDQLRFLAVLSPS